MIADHERDLDVIAGSLELLENGRVVFNDLVELGRP